MKFIETAFWALLFFLTSCSDNGAWSSMDENLVDVNTNVIYTDTSTVNCYTIVRDRVPTSGLSVALVGRYTDGNFGTITASSYFTIGLPSTVTVNDSAICDSTTLNLRYNGSYYGDTLKTYSLDVHQITEVLDRGYVSDTFRYNTSYTSYSTEILGTLKLTPSPLLDERISFRLSDALGKDWFDKFRKGTSEMENNTKFVSYFPGIVLVPTDGNVSSVLGFDATDSIYVTIHYHINDVYGKLVFPMFDNANKNCQYNRIESDRKSTALSGLINLEDVLPSAKTDNQTYVQAGSGIMTKLEFPYLKKYLETEKRTKIVKAELILCPVKGTYDSIPLPSSLSLFNISESNVLGATLYGSDGSTLAPILNTDYLYNLDTRYVFDITSYISSMMLDSAPNIPALSVTIPIDSNNKELYYKSLTRIILGDGTRELNRVKLKLTMWKY